MENNSGSEIHSAPEEFSQQEILLDPVLHFFHYSHLPPKLQETSKAFFLLAKHIVRTVPRTAERTVALRKLLEGKDAAVRANLELPRLASNPGHITKCTHERIYVEQGSVAGRCTRCEVAGIPTKGYAQSASAAPGFLTKFSSEPELGEPEEIGGHDEIIEPLKFES